MALRSCLVPALLLPALLALVATAPAATLEEVSLGQAGYDDATIERPSGERFRLDLRGCQADLRAYGGRTALLWSTTPGPSTDSRLLVPEFDLSCAVVNVDSLEPSRKPRAAAVAPEEGLVAVRQALELLGYDCGPPGRTWSREAATAFLRFRESKRLDGTSYGVRRAVTSLALDVMRGRQATGTGMRLSRVISTQLEPLTRWLSAGGAGATSCADVAWIRAILRDQALVTISDDTTWRLGATGREAAARWSAGEKVTVCSGRMVYWPTGEMLRVTRAE